MDVGLKPTDEQAAIVAAALTGDDLAIEALAGTGKTSTLRMFASEVPKLRGQYLAFNKAIVSDARASFPKTVSCSTAHGLAFRAIGAQYKHRLASPRLSNRDLARWLGCEPFRYRYGDRDHVLNGDQVARYALAMVQNFCKTPDDVISPHHTSQVPMISDDPDVAFAFACHLRPYAETLWADIQDLNGRAHFSHDYYLKMWQLTTPTIPADYILFDEAQDADPVMLTVVNAQDHAQLVYCGDDFQSLYEWRGASNALSLAHVDQRLWLTQSFRFGNAIAEMANEFLRRLDAPKPLRGLATLDSKVGLIARPDAIMCRTNAAVFDALVDCRTRGRRAAVVGGVSELSGFASACEELQQGRRTNHPDLAPFETWAEVLEWIDANPEQSPDVAQKVNLVEKQGADQIRTLLRDIVAEEIADVTICTVHQAKGREWPAVQLSGDYPHPDDMKPEELRVGYVAVTRGRMRLDVGSLFAPKETPTTASRTQVQRVARKRPPIGSQPNSR